MTRTMDRRPRDDRRVAAPVMVAVVLAVVAGLAGLATLSRMVEGPEVRDFTVRNETVWDLQLVVRSGADSERRRATIGARNERELREVIVPGATWRFVWRFDGRDVGSSVVNDAELRRPGFRLEVPTAVATALRAADIPPSP